MYTVNYESAAFILSVTCLLYSLTVKRRQYIVRGGFFSKLQNQHFVFILLLLSNIFSAASSVGGVFLQEIASDKTAAWQYLLHALYFIFHSTLSVCFTLYIIDVTGTGIGRSKRFYLLFSLPYLAAELLILTNSFTGLAFYMDELHIYHRGALMPALYAVGALYIVLGLVFFYRYKQAVSRADSIAIGTVILMASLGIVIQAVRSDLLVELFAEALAFLMLMVMLEERGGHIDPVTGALNRLAFVDANRRYMQTDQHYSIVVVKLANLEQYSRLFSGRKMEKLLQQLATWFTSISSRQDLYCCDREEFAVLVMDDAPGTAERLAQKVLARFRNDWQSDEMTLRLDVAVAVVHVPDELSNLEQLEELLADSFQKNEGGSRLVNIDELAVFRRNRNLEQALRRAIDNRALRIWYQPIRSVNRGRTVAMEALLRVDSEELRGVSPEVFIPIAEKSGLIRDIGLFVFEDVCRFLSEHAEETAGLAYIELNLSIYQFLYDDLPQRFEEIRARYGIPAPRLNFEVTESASDQAASGVAEAIAKLQRLGYSFSLDDFGTGYSNLNRLVSGTYLNIKIDKSLLWDSDHNDDARRLLESLTRVIQSLGYNVMQEGVETPAQLDRVTASGCDLIQGYYFSRPIPEPEILRYLREEQEH